MGSFGVWIVGLYILNNIAGLLGKNDVGLFKDDGLAIYNQQRPNSQKSNASRNAYAQRSTLRSALKSLQMPNY